MKTQLKLILLAAFFMIGATAFAQTGTAVISKNGAVVLDTTQPLKSAYTAPLASFNFNSAQEALDYFASKQSDLISYRPIYQNGDLMIYVQLNQRPDWTIVEWNNHLRDNKIQNTQLTAPTAK